MPQFLVKELCSNSSDCNLGLCLSWWWLGLCAYGMDQNTLVINSLPNDKFLDWSKLKAFADNKIFVTKKLKLVFGRVENVVGKRRKCWLPAFSPFPTMFSKAFFFRVVKSLDCVVELIYIGLSTNLHSLPVLWLLYHLYILSVKKKAVFCNWWVKQNKWKVGHVLYRPSFNSIPHNPNF